MRYKNPRQCSAAEKKVTTAAVRYKFMSYHIRIGHTNMSGGIYWHVELFLLRPELYRVKRGQTLSEIADAFGTTPRLLAAVNHLVSPPEEGMLLALPSSGNVYRVHGGETKTLLCGCEQAFKTRNATEHFYPGQRIIL